MTEREKEAALKDPSPSIPSSTLETIARSFYQEARAYGFGMQDYLRFVNVVLELSHEEPAPSNENARSRAVPAGGIPPVVATDLPIVGSRLAIRAYDEARDIELIRRWLTDRKGRYFLLSRSTAPSPDPGEFLDDPRNAVGMIVLPGQGAIGMVAFLDYDRTQHKAELRKLIGEPSMRGRGYAKEATQLWIAYGLAALQLRKIYLNTLGTNMRNIHLNEELGFKVEGILRNEVLIDGRYHDVLRMGLLVGAAAPVGMVSTDPEAAAREDTTTYLVVVNDEEQYSIWAADRDIPAGWRDVGKKGSKQECLDHIAEVWTDMTPKSLRTPAGG
jgi:MbtH protein